MNIFFFTFVGLYGVIGFGQAVEVTEYVDVILILFIISNYHRRSQNTTKTSVRLLEDIERGEWPADIAMSRRCCSAAIKVDPPPRVSPSPVLAIL